MQPLLLNKWRDIKQFTELGLEYFGLVYVLMFPTGLNNVLTVCSSISPFTTVYVGLWMPDHRIDKNGYMILINVMCDISQFVVVVSATDESSATLAFYLCNTF